MLIEYLWTDTLFASFVLIRVLVSSYKYVIPKKSKI